LGDGFIKKKLNFRRKWTIRNLEKKEKQRLKRKKCGPSPIIYVQVAETGLTPFSVIDNQFKQAAPSNLSFLENREETVEYFNRYLLDARQRIQDRCYFFDISKVSALTCDAVMYILAIADNLYSNPLLHFHYQGNEPNNEIAKRVFKESGFYNYVNGKARSVDKTNDKLQILSRNINDPEVAQDACDFVNRILGLDHNHPKSKALYSLLIEIIGNVKDHAYSLHDRIMRKRWYLYAEKVDHCIKFVFLDTGLGIPYTIRRRIIEKISASDSELIEAAFKEENRSQTKLPYRGNGLPDAYTVCKGGHVKNFTVFSGKGKFAVSTEDDRADTLSDFRLRMYGTLMYWEVNCANG
jgi:hypothetical protein